MSDFKQRLLDYQANDWNIPEELDKYELALECMEHIGSTDPVLRDDLVLSVLWGMICEKMLSTEQLRNLLELSLSEKHLFNFENDDSVFNRAFTALIVKTVLYYHNNIEEFLTEEEINRVYKDVTKYIRLEKDTRGFVEEKGWAHAVAHGADALRTLALCNTMSSQNLQEILEVIKEKVCVTTSVYTHLESERLVTAAVNVIGKNLLSEEEVMNWVKEFEEGDRPSSLGNPEAQYFLENVQRFLRALYFRLKHKNMSVNIINEIEKTSQTLNNHYNNTKTE